nr:MAG TPA: hypothetical protein [Caudoviricetes sp.]
MRKFKYKEVCLLFKDEILERIFTHPEMQKIPIGCQSTAVHVFQEVIEEVNKEGIYGTISELLSE